MTQHPQSPYNPPGMYPPTYQPGYGQPLAYGQGGYAYGGSPMDALLAPAKRAMWLMLILGILSILFGGCFAALGGMWPQISQQMPPESRAQIDRLEQQLQGVQVETYFLIAGVVTLVVGALHVALSFFVRRGTLIPVVFGIVLGGGMLLLLAVALLGNLMTGQAGGICFGGIGVALWGLLLVFLIQAATRSGQVAAARSAAGYGGAQYAAQYWQYQHAQQQQQPPPPGYGLPPPP